jgi:peptidoglycan/xylan/chitin deacetylase (PgdA/CDA1 family)
MSKRERAASILGSSAARRVWASAHVGAGGLRILAYHRVLDAAAPAFTFDDELISATTASFRRQMDFVRRNFNVISFEQLNECERERGRWPERALIITFDDGYRDNYTHAFPILREMGLCATIFLAVGHVGEAKLFWWDFVAYCFKQTRRRAVAFPELGAAPLPLTGMRERLEAIRRVLEWIKEVKEEVKRRFLSELSDQLEVAMPDGLAEGMHLTWDDVRQMAAGGIEFGSHTMTHPILSNVTERQLYEEVTLSKERLEQQLDKDVIAFSYPVGGRASFNGGVKEAVNRCGFRYAVSYQEGVAEKNSDRYSLPRIHVEAFQSLELFRANLMFPRLMLMRGAR